MRGNGRRRKKHPKKAPEKKHPKSTRAIAPSWSGRACPRARSPGLKHPAAGQAHKASVLAAKHTKTSTCQLPTDSAAFQLPLPPKHPGSSSRAPGCFFRSGCFFWPGAFFGCFSRRPAEKAPDGGCFFKKHPKKTPYQKSTRQRVLFRAAAGPRVFRPVCAICSISGSTNLLIKAIGPPGRDAHG